MKKFFYKVVDKDSKIRQGTIEGADIDSVSSSFHDQGLTIIELKEPGFSLENLKELNVGGIPFKEKVTFIRQMAFMVNAGLSITQSLEITKNQIKNSKFRKVIDQVLRDVQGGMNLSKSLKKQGNVFDGLVINLIRAAEESGNMDMILIRIADDMEKKQEFKSKVRGAMIYPIIILVAVVIVIVMMLMFMIPQMAKLFEDSGAELPLPTRIIMSASNFLNGIGGVFFFAFVAFAIGFFIYYKKTPSGKLVTDKMILKIPIFGVLTNKAQVASFCSTFSMLLSSGVTFLDALDLVASATTNMVYKNTILAARKKVEKGIPLSVPLLTSKVFPDLVGHMTRVGEETGNMDAVVSKVGIQYAKEVDQMASNMTKLMEPLVLIIMGVVVGILALAVYLPIFSMGDVITQQQ